MCTEKKTWTMATRTSTTEGSAALRATKKKQTVTRVKKPHATVVTITNDEMRSELLWRRLRGW